MRLRYLGKTMESDRKDCPSVFVAEDGAFVIQGTRAYPAWLGDDQAAVTIPPDVIDHVPDLPTGHRPAFPVLQDGRYLVVGPAVEDAEALAELRRVGLPQDENAVWVPADVIRQPAGTVSR